MNRGIGLRTFIPARARNRRRGYLEELPPGSVRAVVFAGTDPLTGRLRYIREICKTTSEAEVALTKLLRQFDQQQHPKTATTVHEAIEQWMEVVDLEVTTRERYEDLIRIYISSRLGDLQAAKLDAELLERFYARLQRCRELCPSRPERGHVCKPLSSSTTRKIHYIFRGALDRTVRGRYLSVNPTELVEALAPQRTKPDPPSSREAAALLNEAWADPEWGLLLWLTMVTGFRRGELCSLRWRHLDTERATLWVQHSTAQATRAGAFEKDTKTETDRRVSVDPHTLELLSAHRAAITARCAQPGVGLDDAFRGPGRRRNRPTARSTAPACHRAATRRSPPALWPARPRRPRPPARFRSPTRAPTGAAHGTHPPVKACAIRRVEATSRIRTGAPEMAPAGADRAAFAASTTACISASTSNGALAVAVSSGAATAARILSGQGQRPGCDRGAPTTSRRIVTPGCRHNGPTPPGPSIGRHPGRCRCSRGGTILEPQPAGGLRSRVRRHGEEEPGPGRSDLVSWGAIRVQRGVRAVGGVGAQRVAGAAGGV
jgi:integrase